MAIKPYDERLDQLLRTAADVFAEKGFHPTTMRDLARATGMSLAGMYHYVAGKEELLFLIQRQCFENVYQGALQAVESAAGPTQRLRAFIRHHVTFFAQHMSEMKVLSHEAGSLSGERERPIIDLKRRYVDLLAGLIEALDTPRDVRIAAYALFGMMNWIYTWYHTAGPLSAEELAEQFTQLYLYGLQAPSTPVSPAG